MAHETSDTHREQPGDGADTPERATDTPAESAAASAENDQDDDLAWAGPPGSLLRYLTLQEHAGPISGL